MRLRRRKHSKNAALRGLRNLPGPVSSKGWLCMRALKWHINTPLYLTLWIAFQCSHPFRGNCEGVGWDKKEKKRNKLRWYVITLNWFIHLRLLDVSTHSEIMKYKEGLFLFVITTLSRAAPIYRVKGKPLQVASWNLQSNRAWAPYVGGNLDLKRGSSWFLQGKKNALKNSQTVEESVYLCLKIWFWNNAEAWKPPEVHYFRRRADLVVVPTFCSNL